MIATLSIAARLARAAVRGAVHGVRRELALLDAARLVSAARQRRAADALTNHLRNTARDAGTWGN